MMQRLLSALLIAVSTVALCLPAHAHDLDASTARVTLRDGHVVVLAEFDVLSLLSERSDHDTTLDTLATASDGDLAARLSTARKALESTANLSADGHSVPLVLRTFPTTTDIRAMATAMTNAPDDHAPRIKVRMEATESALDARSVSVRLPASLGPVLYTFDQPAVSLAAPGSAASFPVLTARAPTATAEPQRSTSRSWLSIGAGLLAAIAIAVQLLPMFRRRRSARGRDNDLRISPLDGRRSRASVAAGKVSS